MMLVMVMIVVMIVVVVTPRHIVIVVVVVFMPRVSAGRETATMGIGIHQDTERHLSDAVAALGAAGSSPGRLKRRQQEPHERADDGSEGRLGKPEEV